MKLSNNNKEHCISSDRYPLRRKIQILQERKRIADDLHDEIGPMLSAIKLRLLTLKRMESHQEISSAVDKITTDMDFLIQDVRRIIRNISPGKLKQDGLIKSIEDYRNLIQMNNIHFDFKVEIVENDLKEEASINIYRILLELINNSIKHSHCKKINVLFKTYNYKTLILYSDDGCKQTTNDTSQICMGLKSIKTRVDALEGKIDLSENFSNGAFCEILFDNKVLLKKKIDAQ